MTWNRCTFFFSDGSYGWSENYFDTVQNADLNATWNKAVKLSQKRVNLLAQGNNPCDAGRCGRPSLTFIRISTVGVARRTLIGSPTGVMVTNAQQRAYWNAPQGSDAGVQASAADNPYSAMLFTLNCANGSSSKRPLSGVPDSAVCNQALSTGDPFVKAFKAFAKELADDWGCLTNYGNYAAGNQSAWYTPNPNAQGGLGPSVPILNITQDANGQPILTLPATGLPLPTGFNSSCGYRVFVWGFVGDHKSPVINGVFRAVTMTPAPGMTGPITSILLKRKLAPIGPWACPGWVQVYYPVVVPFQDAVLERPMKKSRGRPFGLSRGKSRTHR